MQFGITTKGQSSMTISISILKSPVNIPEQGKAVSPLSVDHISEFVPTTSSNTITLAYLKKRGLETTFTDRFLTTAHLDTITYYCDNMDIPLKKNLLKKVSSSQHLSSNVKQWMQRELNTDQVKGSVGLGMNAVRSDINNAGDQVTNYSQTPVFLFKLSNEKNAPFGNLKIKYDGSVGAGLSQGNDENSEIGNLSNAGAITYTSLNDTFSLAISGDKQDTWNALPGTVDNAYTLGGNTRLTLGNVKLTGGLSTNASTNAAIVGESNFSDQGSGAMNAEGLLEYTRGNHGFNILGSYSNSNSTLPAVQVSSARKFVGVGYKNSNSYGWSKLIAGLDQTDGRQYTEGSDSNYSTKNLNIDLVMNWNLGKLISSELGNTQIYPALSAFVGEDSEGHNSSEIWGALAIVYYADNFDIGVRSAYADSEIPSGSDMIHGKEKDVSISAGYKTGKMATRLFLRGIFKSSDGPVTIDQTTISGSGSISWTPETNFKLSLSYLLNQTAQMVDGEENSITNQTGTLDINISF